MKKIFIFILLIFFFCSKSFAQTYFFKDCKISNAVTGTYIINLEKNAIEVELKVCTCDEEFDPKKLVFQITKNEFFEDVGEYITGIEYRDEYLETGDFEDIDGDYFSSVSFKVE